MRTTIGRALLHPIGVTTRKCQNCPVRENQTASSRRFIVQVAALSWAATQVPEITVAIHSFLKAGFLSAVQVELLFMIGGLHPLQRQPGLRVSGILFLNAISPAIVKETRNFLWNATMVRRRRVRRAFTPRAGQSS
jgi:hypothetical protein